MQNCACPSLQTSKSYDLDSGWKAGIVQSVQCLGYEMYFQNIMVQNLEVSKYLSFLQNFQTGSGSHPASSIQGINPSGCEADHVRLVSRLMSGAIPALPVCVHGLHGATIPYTLSILVRGSPGFELTQASISAPATQHTVRSNKRSYIKPVCN